MVAIAGTGPKLLEPAEPRSGRCRAAGRRVRLPGVPQGSLDGRIAVIERGDCDFEFKVANAAAAGADGCGRHQRRGEDEPFVMPGLETTDIPAYMIGDSDGNTLYCAAGWRERACSSPWIRRWWRVTFGFDLLAPFSSRGPSPDNNIKPDLVAPGEFIYAGAQTFRSQRRHLRSDRIYLGRRHELFSPDRRRRRRPGDAAASRIQRCRSEIGAGQHRRARDRRRRPAGAGQFRGRGSARYPGCPGSDRDGSALPRSASARRRSHAAVAAHSTAAQPAGARSKPTASRSNRATPMPMPPCACRARTPVNVTLAPGASSDLTVSLEGATPLPGSYEGFLRVSAAVRRRRPGRSLLLRAR